MAEQPKKKVRRQPTAATLYKHLTAFMELRKFDEAGSVQALLGVLKDEIVAEAIKR